MTSVTRTVKVNRGQTPLQAFKSITSHKQYLNETVVASMPTGPTGDGQEVELHFFLIKKILTCAEFTAEMERRGLCPDPMAQAAYNEANPAFADKYPNGTQWQDVSGKFCYALWRDWCGDRLVVVGRDGIGWGVGWFACGVPK